METYQSYFRKDIRAEEAEDRMTIKEEIGA
jgi:hypothetical protein